MLAPQEPIFLDLHASLMCLARMGRLGIQRDSFACVLTILSLMEKDVCHVLEEKSGKLELDVNVLLELSSLDPDATL